MLDLDRVIRNWLGKNGDGKCDTHVRGSAVVTLKKEGMFQSNVSKLRCEGHT